MEIRFKSIIFTILCLHTIGSSAQAACEFGWTKYQESCYPVLNASWTVANFLVPTVLADEYFWIGCSDLVNEGNWVCEDQSGMFFNTNGIRLGYWNWNPLEPNGAIRENGLEHRLELTQFGEGTGWKDMSYTATNLYVCEYEYQTETSWTAEIVKPRTTTAAPKDLDRELGVLTEVNVSTENVLKVTKSLTVLAEGNVEMDDYNLEDISNILYDIVAVKNQSLNVTESVVNTVDNIIKSYVGETSFDNEVKSVPEAPNQIQRSLEQQITKLQTNPDIVNATIKDRNVVIQAVKVPKESVVSRRLVFETIPEGHNEILKTTVMTREAGEQSEDEVEESISFQLPIEILSDIDGYQSLAVSFFVYNDATLFPSTILVNSSSGKDDQDYVQRIVASRVISATLEGIEVKNLPKDNPIEIIFALNKVNEYDVEIDEIFAIECVFWDIMASNGLGDWSNDGCQYNRTLSDGRVVCHCNHLTSIAVIVDIYNTSTSSRYLYFVGETVDILSKVGCGISIACLLVTVITLLSARSLRKRKSKQILISLCFSLLFLYVVFVIGIERGTKSDTGCIMVSALLHYFTLTSMAWMAVEAYQLYCLSVDHWLHISRFLLKASLLAWGLPAIMVIIVLIVDVNLYNNENHCFLQIGYAFYFTHLLVLGLVVILNTVIFGLVIYRLTCGRKQIRNIKYATTSLTRNKQEEREAAKISEQEASRRRQEHLRRAQNAILKAITIFSLMGLIWGLGLFALLPRDLGFLCLIFFAILNPLHGAIIFVILCVQQAEVRAIWKEHISSIWKHIFCCKTNGNEGHAEIDVSNSPGCVSDTGRKALSGDIATSKL